MQRASPTLKSYIRAILTIDDVFRCHELFLSDAEGGLYESSLLKRKLFAFELQITKRTRTLDRIKKIDYSPTTMNIIPAYSPRARRRRQTPGLDFGVP
jgi:hypothetical protein